MSIFKRLVAFGGYVRNSVRRSVLDVAGASVPTGGDTLLITLPQVNAAFNPVKVTYTVVIGGPQARADILFKLFRNGVEINVAERYDQGVDTPGTTNTVTMHWVDTSPGQKPIYTILGEAITANVALGIQRGTLEI